jgi:hypothetical protein
LKTFKLIQFAGIILLLALSPRVFGAEEDKIPLTITDPYIEMRTGPGSGYPIFHVVDRGEKIIILKRKTAWYKIRTLNGKEGWGTRDQMQKTLLPDGEQLKFAELNQGAFIERNWELGVSGGQLEDAPITSVYAAYNFTPNFSTEFTLGHSVGNVSSSFLYKLNLLMQPFPEWGYSPFFTLGLGSIDVKPSATLIEPADKNNQFSHLGLGIRKYLSRRFMLRLEVGEYVIFSASNDKDENEDISEWKLGFAIFF